MNVVSGLFSLDASMVIVLACVIGAVQVAVHILKRAADMWIDAAEQRPARDVTSRWDPPEIAPEDETTWPEKAPLKLVPKFVLASPPIVISGSPERFALPETRSETSGRHAELDATSQMDAVDDEPAPAEEVGVS